MARLLILVLAVVGATATTVVPPKELPASAAKVVKEADALPALISQQWTKLLSEKRALFGNLQTGLLKAQTPAMRAVLSAAYSTMNKAIGPQMTATTDFVKKQAADVAKIAAQYKALIQQRIKAYGAAATNEAPVQALRLSTQALVKSWETGFENISLKTRSLLASALHTFALNHPEGKQQLSKAYGAYLLQILDNQMDVLNLITVTQTSAVNSLSIKAESVVLQKAIGVQVDQL